MATIDHFQELRVKYSEILNQLNGYPDYQRVAAENRFILIKQYEEFSKREAERLGKNFRKIQVLKDFCNQNQKNWKTFYGYMTDFKKGGIKALPPAFGHRAGKSRYSSVLPYFDNAIEPGKGYVNAFRKLLVVCEQEGISAPSYHTFRRLAIENGFSVKTPKTLENQTSETIKEPEEKKEIDEEDYGLFEHDTPDWIRIVDKKAFNVAFYKYCLVVPFLNPALDRDEKIRLINEIVSRTHRPIKGVKIKISRGSLYRYISIVESEGFWYQRPGSLPKPPVSNLTTRIVWRTSPVRC